MTEILWHGRGGQGAFTAARLLGAAYVAESDGFYALAFPSFGPERRGAPIRAFTKLSDSPVGDRSQVVKADYSIYLDDTLFTDAAFDELKENGKIILNTRRKVDDERVITLDGTAIAQEIRRRYQIQSGYRTASRLKLEMPMPLILLSLVPTLIVQPSTRMRWTLPLSVRPVV